jgi:hypothetical protein
MSSATQPLARLIHRRRKPRMRWSSAAENGPIWTRMHRLSWAEMVHEQDGLAEPLTGVIPAGTGVSA